MNTSTSKLYKPGHLINHDCIFKGDVQNQTYIAIDEVVNTFTLDKDVFMDACQNYKELKTYIDKEVIGK